MQLITGGSGRLGSEIRKYLKLYAPSSRELDLSKPFKPYKDIDCVIHCAAYTDVEKAETEQDKCYEMNVNGTKRLSQAYPRVPFVFISTEYAINPMNYYSKTKRWAEDFLKKRHDPYLIIRTLFKPNPFPWDKAYVDQWTMGDYVDVIAKLIVKEMLAWDQVNSKEVHLGTGRKTMFDLALRTNPNVGRTFTAKSKVSIPKDYI